MEQNKVDFDELKTYLIKGKKRNRISDLALENKYVFFNNFDEVHFKDKFDWNYKHSHSPSTYQVYMHALNMVGGLVASYDETGREDYINKAHQILMDWFSSDANQYGNNRNASWKDHSVSSRIKNILLYQLVAPEHFKLDDKDLESQLKLHGDYLSDRKHYSENNHGMMIDEALLLTSNFIKTPATSERFREVAVLRMERIIYKLFSSMSLNLENSPEYHRLTQILSGNFIRLTEIMGIEFDQRCKDIIDKSNDLNSQLIKPDHTYPLIGDTGQRKFKVQKSFDNLIDYQAGLAIINSPNNEKDERSSWLSFKSGYVTKSHKQLDDLSVNYYHNGEDILVDSGKYNYDGRDPMKQYVKSPKAHSTIFHKEEPYQLNTPLEDYNRMRLQFVQETAAYVHLAGINHLHENLNIWRDIIYFENRGVVIIDRYNADGSRLMSQNFNLHEELKVNKLGGNEFEIVTPNEKRLILKEHTLRTLNRYYPHDHKERGFISREFSKFIETQQLEFIKKSFRNKFITTLHEPNEIEIDDIFEEDGLLTVNVDSDPIKIYLQKVSH